MATRWGWHKAILLTYKGWSVKPEKEEEKEDFRCDDPIMIDPLDGKEYTPYEAEEIQAKRDGRNIGVSFSE